MTRRDFVGMFLVGGLAGLFRRRVLGPLSKAAPRRAMFWSTVDKS